MDPIVAEVLDAVRRDDRARLVELLHPYLHWSAPGVTIRGRTKLFAHLASEPPPAPPTSYELRDGQIYRWTA
jgi:hypothetical protein